MIDRLLAKVAARRPLTTAEIAALEDAFLPPRAFQQGDELVAQDSTPKASSLLLRGLAARVVTLKRGFEQITELQVPGDMVDLHSYGLRTMDHSVVAMTDGEFALLPHERIDRIVASMPGLTKALWLMTMVDAAIHRQWITSLGRRDGAQRLAHLLCELYVRLAVVDLAKEGAFDLPLSQSELAAVLGQHRGTVNESLGELRARKLLRWSSARVHILDWQGLAELAEFDPTYLQLVDPPV